MTSEVSPYRLERAMSVLMQGRDALLAADSDLADDEAELMRLLGDNAETAEALGVLHGLVRAAILAEGRAIQAKAMIERLYSRKARFERRHEKLRDLILSVMQALDVPRIVEADFTVSRRVQKPKVIVTDDKALPATLLRLTTTAAPDKVAIRAELEAGVIVPGACLGNPYETITISK